MALSDQAPTLPGRALRLDPLQPGRADGGGAAVAAAASSTSSTAPSLGAGWDVVRQDQQMTVSGSTLNIPAAAGRHLRQTPNNAKNLVMRDAPSGPWVATTKMNFKGAAQYHQAGLVSTATTTTSRSSAASPRTPPARRSRRSSSTSTRTRARRATTRPTRRRTWRRAFPDDYWMRITSDGTNITGAYSTDGNAWTPVGRAAPLPANAKIGMFSFSNAATTATRWPPSTRSPSPVTTSAAAGRPEPRRRVRRREPRQDALERDRARHPGRVRGVGRQPDDHDLARRHLHGRHHPAAEQLHPPVGRSRRRGLGDRDEGRLGRSTAATARAA